MNLKAKLTPLSKINKLDHSLNVKWITVKRPGNNIGENLDALGYGDDF